MPASKASRFVAVAGDRVVLELEQVDRPARCRPGTPRRCRVIFISVVPSPVTAFLSMPAHAARARVLEARRRPGRRPSSPALAWIVIWLRLTFRSFEFWSANGCSDLVSWNSPRVLCNANPLCSGLEPRTVGDCSSAIRSTRLHRWAVLIAIAVMASAAPARAADPIMPLSEVQRRDELHRPVGDPAAPTISSFDVQVLDVIAGDPSVGGARLLVRVSGPAVDDTGVGPRLLGLADPLQRRATPARSPRASAEYGNKVVLATPIEAILGAPPARLGNRAQGTAALLTAARRSPARSPCRAPRRACWRCSRRAAKRAGQPLARRARRAARRLSASRTWCPGAAVAASLSTGDLGFGAVGTVAYRDGDQVYAFGHALDAAGRALARSSRTPTCSA